MENINYTKIKSIRDIEIIRNMESFKYKLDQSTINTLVKHFILEDSLYLLAKQDEKFAGFCSIDRGWWEDGYFFVREIIVDQGFRKLNIGYELMSRCITHAKKCGAVGVITETAFDNIPMQRLSQKLGFKEWENSQWKDGITYKMIF